MKLQKSESKVSDWLKENGEKETAEFVEYSLQLAETIREGKRVHELSDKAIAEKLGETEDQVKKWQTGFHNFTIRELIRLGMIFYEIE